MKKQIIFSLIIALFTTNSNTQEIPKKTLYPTPKVLLTIENQTKNNVALMADEKVMTGIKSGETKKNLQIPMEITFDSNNINIFVDKKNHAFILPSTQEKHPLNIRINKNKKREKNPIAIVIDLKKPSTQEEYNDFLKDYFQVKTDEELKQVLEKIKKEGKPLSVIPKKDYFTEIISIKDNIKAPGDIEKSQDTYQITITLKGDNLEDSEIDYIGSIK